MRWLSNEASQPLISCLEAEMEAMQAYITSITPEEAQRIRRDLTDLLVRPTGV